MRKSMLFLLVMLSSALGQNENSSSAPKINTFTLNPDLKGLVGNSVNMFTGDLNLPLNLASLPGKNGLDVSLSIVYSSNIQHIVDTWNTEAPTGILGLGWSMDYDKIIVDHKNTGSRHDDEFYLISGGSSNLLVRTGTAADGAYLYETKNYQFWIVRYYPTDERWEIVKEDGSTNIFGGGLTSDGNGKHGQGESVQWGVKWGNWIGNSALTTGQQQYAAGWNLSKIRNLLGNEVSFEYLQSKNRVGSGGQYHTEAGYLQKIVDTYGRKVTFQYSAKDTNEYVEPHREISEPDAYQERYETLFLSAINLVNESDSLLMTIEFGYGYKGYAETIKRVLTSITQKNARGESLPNIQFTYRDANPNKYAMENITLPSGGHATYTYSTVTPALSNRDLQIDAPPGGFIQPRTWISDDYVVVTWRKGNDVDSLVVFAYVWDGRWVPSGELLRLGGIGRNDTEGQDFEVEVQSEFFALLAETANSGSNKYLHIFRRDPGRSDNWLHSNYTLNVVNIDNDGVRFFSGKRYVGVLGAESGKLFRLKWTGTAWSLTEDVQLHSDSRNHFWGSGGYNYFIVHDQNEYMNGGNWVNDQDITKFYFLDEFGNWVSRTLNSAYNFNTGGGNNTPVYWHPGATFGVAFPEGVNKRVYWWDEDFNVGQAPLSLNNVDHESRVLVDDSKVAIAEKNGNPHIFLRFDGGIWVRKDTNSSNGHSIGSGPDFVAFSLNQINTSGAFNCFTYDPNFSTFRLESWNNGGTTGSIVRPGNDFFLSGPFYNGGPVKFLRRTPFGTWNVYPPSGASFATTDPRIRVGQSHVFLGMTFHDLKNGYPNPSGSNLSGLTMSPDFQYDHKYQPLQMHGSNIFLTCSTGVCLSHFKPNKYRVQKLESFVGLGSIDYGYGSMLFFRV